MNDTVRRSRMHGESSCITNTCVGLRVFVFLNSVRSCLFKALQRQRAQPVVSNGVKTPLDGSPTCVFINVHSYSSVVQLVLAAHRRFNQPRKLFRLRDG
jgi:hypothetical protein